MSKQQKSNEQVEQEQEQLKQYAEQLNKLGTDISERNALCIEHGKVSLKLAYEAGKILNAITNMCDRGEWQPWVAENVKTFDLRTAQNYMRLASKEDDRQRWISGDLKGRNAKIVSLIETCDNISAAYRAIGIIKDKKESKDKKPTPKDIKKKDPDAYEEAKSKAVEGMNEAVAKILKDNSEANWNVTQWSIDKDNKLRFGGGANTGYESARHVINRLCSYAGFQDFKTTLVRDDEISHKVGVVFGAVFRIIMQTTNPAPAKSENFSMEFNQNTKNKRKPIHKNGTSEAVEALRVVTPAAAASTTATQDSEEVVTAE